MMSWDVALGYFTGLRWISADLDPGTLVRTALLVHICDAVVCRVIAGNKGYSRWRWSALGLVSGVWAMIVLLFLPSRPNARDGTGEGRTGQSAQPSATTKATACPSE